MVREQTLQSQILKWLRSKGCFAMKVQAGPGVPSGTADVFFCKEGFYGFLEVKALKTSKKQPHQADFIAKMDEWSYGKFVWGGKNSNWPEVREELDAIL